MSSTYLDYFPITVQVLPRISATLSTIGSSWIVYDVSCKGKLKKANHRILLGMSISDIVASICTALGRIPAPSDVEEYSGLGNTQTCSAQGFFYQAIVSTVSYNSALALYYLLVVKYQWKENDVEQIEGYMHGFAILIFLVSGCVLLGFNLFNPDFFICFIASLPSGCQSNCERGIKPYMFRWIFFYGPVWTMILSVTVIMILVYQTVLRQERKMDKFVFRPECQYQQQLRQDQSGNSSSSQQHNRHTSLSQSRQKETKRRKYSRHVAIQGLWYVVPFYLTWLFPMLTHALASSGIKSVNYNVLLNLVAFFMPLQGFMNLLVYLRPQYLSWYKQRVRRWTESNFNMSYSRFFRQFIRRGHQSGVSVSTSVHHDNKEQSVNFAKQQMDSHI